MYDHYDPQHPTYLFTHNYDTAPTEPIPVITEPVKVTDPDLVCETSGDNQISYRESMGLMYAISFLLPIACTLGGGFIGFVVGAFLGLVLGIVNLVVYFRRLRAISNGNVDAQFSQGEIRFHNAVALGAGALALAKGIEHLENRHAELLADKLRQGGFGS